MNISFIPSVNDKSFSILIHLLSSYVIDIVTNSNSPVSKLQVYQMV